MLNNLQPLNTQDYGLLMNWNLIVGRIGLFFDPFSGFSR
jgi:hypothetical protein